MRRLQRSLGTVECSAREKLAFPPWNRVRQPSLTVPRGSTQQPHDFAARPPAGPWRPMPSRKVPQSITELVASGWSHSFGFFTGSLNEIALEEQLFPNRQPQGLKKPEPMGWRQRGHKNPKSDPATAAQQIRSLLQARSESIPEQRWMQVDPEIIDNVNRQLLFEELDVLDCEYEEYGGLLWVAMTGQCAGKNAIEEHLEESLSLIDLDTNRHDSIRLDTWSEAAEIDVAAYLSSQIRKAKNQRGKRIPDVWVEVGHYSAPDDVERVRKKFNVRKITQDCPETIFCFLGIPSLDELEKCVTRFPWRDSSYPFEACTEILSSYEEARKQAMSAKPKHFILGVWQLDPKNERTFDCGGEWYVLTVDNYVDLELKWNDGQSSRLRLHGIDLVHADDKVEVKYSSTDENFDKAVESMVETKFTREAGPGYSTMEGKQGVAAYRKFTIPMNKPK